MHTSPHMHTLHVAHSMSTWAVPSAGTGLAYMSLHVSRARLHESSSSADYLLGKSKGNGRKVRALRPLPLHMRPCSHAASTFAQVDCAFFWVLFHDPGRHPCILVEMNAPPRPSLTVRAAGQNRRRVCGRRAWVGMDGRRRCRGARVFVSRPCL